MIKKRKPLSATEALARLTALCNASEQCSYDLLRKLASWGISQTDTARIMERLVSTRLLDDRRFAGAYARDKMRYSLWGRLKIRAGLYAKRVGRDDIDDALASLDADEYAEAATRAVMSAAARHERPLTYEAKMKILRHCVARGFEPSVIVPLVRHLD